MKTRALAIVIAVSLLAVCLTPVAVQASTLSFNPSTGPTGTEVAIPGPGNYGKGNYYIYWETSSQLLSQGTVGTNTISIGFVVPETTRGRHKVILKIGEDTYERDFIVTPLISINSNQGAVGTSVTVTGKGFDSNESVINVTYDTIPVQTAVRASSKGSWQATFKVPTSSRGKHVIDAGGSTPAAEVDDQQFVVIPQITINPASGWVGSVLDIMGTGFDIGETNINITYDGLATKGGVTADAKGSWQSNFSIPTSATGVHMIDAHGATTQEADVPDVTFTISPGIKLELISGYLGGAIRPGDRLWVSGVGFESNEAGIQITFDGNMATSSIIADTKGSWSAQIEVPSTTRGEHKISASGEYTKSSDLTAAILVISPTIYISPTSGAVGNELVINGSGFGVRQAVTISIDGAQLTTGSAVSTDTKGTFTASAKVPRGKAGDRTITVTDTSASVASAKFTVESSPPPTPNPLVPEAGKQLSAPALGFGKSAVTFKWSPVEDPSGVWYTLEVSNSAGFTGAILHKEDLTQPEYTLGDDEALGQGEYFWHVRAVDGAGVNSDWTNGQLFRIVGMNLMTMALIAAAVIILVLIIRRIVAIRRQGSGWSK